MNKCSYTLPQDIGGVSRKNADLVRVGAWGGGGGERGQKKKGNKNKERDVRKPEL